MHYKDCTIRLWLAATLLALLTACANQTTREQPVSITGTDRPELYIWPNSNSHSNNEASIRLLVNAGSLQETGSELGYAHFVEHMAFNGTAAYPGKALRVQLDALGITLGSHSNAYTTFDHTLYELNLNTVTPERLDTAIELLAEWAYRIEFDEQEVEQEKPVIIEEWRLSESEADRVDARIQENYYGGSRLAERKPIGTRSSIETATADALKAFYQRWYRANNMAIIVAGDVDDQLVADLVEEHFPADTQRSPEPDTHRVNPAAMEDRLILTDPYAASGYVAIDHYVDHPSVETKDDLFEMEHWIAALDIWHDRVQARLQETEGAVVGADYHWDHLGNDTLNIGLSANLAGDDFEQAIGIIEGERQRIIASGIEQTELDDWRNSLLEYERSQQDSAAHLAGLVTDNILYDWPLLGQPERIAEYEERLPELTPQSVQTAFTRLFSPEPKVTLVHPYRSPAPSVEDIDTWLASVEVVPTISDTANQADRLWAIDPTTTGSVVSEESLAQNVTRWTLGNGMTVYYRHSDQTPGKVFYELYGVHGFDALSPSETADARLALPTLGTSGLRDLNGTQLSEWLDARAITQVPTFSFFDRGMYGSGPSQQFPVMMRLLHVALTEARVDEAAWRHIRNQNREYLSQLQGHPHEPWHQTLQTTLFRDDAAFTTLTHDELNRIDRDSIQAIYDRYFSGTQNYHLSIVGDIGKKAARESVLEAIATLPQQSADWGDTRLYPAAAESVTHKVTGSGEQTATAVLRYSLPKTRFQDTTFTDLSLLEAWLDRALFEDIRENKGSVYTIDSVVDGSTMSQDEVTLIIELSTDPDNADAVVSDVKTRLESLAGSPATNRELEQWHQSLKRDFEQHIKGAEQQAEALAYAPLYGKDPVESLTFNSATPATPEQLANLIADFTGPDTKLVELIWMP